MSAETLQPIGNIRQTAQYELPEVDKNSPLGIALIILELKADNLEDEQVMKKLENELKERIKTQSETSINLLKKEGLLNTLAPLSVMVIAAAITGVGQMKGSAEIAATLAQTFSQISQSMITGGDQTLFAPYKQEADNGLQMDQAEQSSVYQPASQAREDASRTASQTASAIVQRG